MIEQLGFLPENLAYITELEKKSFGKGASSEWVLSPFLLCGIVAGFRHDGVLKGAAELFLCIEPDAVFLFSFMLSPEFRGQKLSKQFMQELIDFLKIKGYKKLMLTVDESNIPAWKIYEHFGFQKERYLKNVYGQGIHRWLMWVSL